MPRITSLTACAGTVGCTTTDRAVGTAGAGGAGVPECTLPMRKTATTRTTTVAAAATIRAAAERAGGRGGPARLRLGRGRAVPAPRLLGMCSGIGSSRAAVCGWRHARLRNCRGRRALRSGQPADPPTAATGRRPWCVPPGGPGRHGSLPPPPATPHHPTPCPVVCRARRVPVSLLRNRKPVRRSRSSAKRCGDLRTCATPRWDWRICRSPRSKRG